MNLIEKLIEKFKKIFLKESLEKPVEENIDVKCGVLVEEEVPVSRENALEFQNKVNDELFWKEKGLN